MLEQFKNLLDPGTTLGAYLISILASITISFLAGYQVCSRRNHKQKQSNQFRAFSNEGNVVQSNTITGEEYEKGKEGKENKSVQSV